MLPSWSSRIDHTVLLESPFFFENGCAAGSAASPFGLILMIPVPKVAIHRFPSRSETIRYGLEIDENAPSPSRLALFPSSLIPAR